MGKVERYIQRRIKEEGAIHITLLDPERQPPEAAARMASEAEAGGSMAIMVGGSTVVSTAQVDDTVKSIKEAVGIPVILFPNNVSGISRHADAIWFMSLLNSSNPYFIIKAQVLGAPIVKEYGIEAIPMGYIILTRGSTAAHIGDVYSLPLNRPRLIASYALAAQYLGMHFVYLEGGSGARRPVPTNVVREVRRTVQIPILVGGGIRRGEEAKERVEAGADIIVTGTIVEEAKKVKGIIEKLVKSIRTARR
ncbi:TPA: geranylgeranylglyceryl/heptaprenylglyceryl phosphate synthase [Candidatus Bathyarchaeota archaeon]|nr:geranylgeranylglyceryl/heptaprenylglyceryl phosphate synthase [Candidatus Bathyarchaeota archaeon]